MKKKVLLFITLILLSSTITKVSAIDYNFKENEDYYAALCSSSAAAKNVTACTAYQAYVNKKVKDSEALLKELQAELKNLSANILAMAKKIGDYEKQITALEKDIVNLEKAIKNSDRAIGELEVQIVIRSENIDAIDDTIKDRMIKMQSFVSLNSFIDFMMGASDFSDLVIRIEGINDITDYDRNQMNLLVEQVNALNQDKAEVERQKASQVQNKVNMESNQATIVSLKTSISSILVEYRRQQDEIQAKAQEIAGDLAETKAILKGVAEALKNVPTSSGFIRPVGNFRISAGVWYYPEGGVHLGADFATPVGTSIKAVANGVVIYSSNSCPTYGYLGNSCGRPGRSGGGNQVYLIVSVNNKSYAIAYLHLQQNTALPIGRIVDGTDTVGKVGTSGSSTGAHAHVEIIYLGNNSVGYYANSWKGDLNFGTRNGSSGLNFRCDYNGHSAPCRENPLTFFNVQVGRSY
ncbi:MAG: Peptidase M23 family [Erysipelotrichaceae bacterium]|nr:MAG: Peptidase M23 [Erysipelotrichaceae bacterium]TXT19487.1 MAG: Peptidase M23 family [Erysipelotrichaceae bacterium]